MESPNESEAGEQILSKYNLNVMKTTSMSKRL